MSQQNRRESSIDYLKSYKQNSVDIMQKIAEEDVARLIELLADAR